MTNDESIKADPSSSITEPSSAALKKNVIVVVCCGLPGAGKSSLCHLLQQQEESSSDNDDGTNTSCHVIEYDALQGQHAAENISEEEEDEEEEFSSKTLEAWRQTRVTALQELENLLRLHFNDEKDDKDRNDSSVRIYLDDNFHLRSMRKRVYQVCQKFVSNHSSNSIDCIYFAILWVDTPVDVCLERNRHRQLGRRVEESVILKMAESAEPPNEIYHWERVNLRVNNNAGGNQNNILSTIQEFLSTLTEHHKPIPSIVADDTEKDTQEALRLDEERTKTLQPVRHQADQTLRRCVGAVGQFRPSSARQANSVRQSILKELQQLEQEDNGGIVVDIQQVFLNRFFAGEDFSWTPEDKERLSEQIRESEDRNN